MFKLTYLDFKFAISLFPHCRIPEQWGTVSVECIKAFNLFYEGTYTGNWNISFNKFCFGAFSNVDVDVYGPADELSNIRQLTKTSYIVAGSTSLQNATMSINFVSFGV